VTWLPIGLGGGSQADAVLGLKPEVYRHWPAVRASAFEMTDAATLDVCRLRIAQLYGVEQELADVDAARLAAVAAWRDDSSGLSARERAALAYAEQFVIDQNGVRGELEAALAAELGAKEDVIRFAFALWAVDAELRALAILGVEDRIRVGASEAGAEANEGPGPDWSSEEVDYMSSLLTPAFWKAVMTFGPASCAETDVDALTSEACRLRNANHQQCRY